MRCLLITTISFFSILGLSLSIECPANQYPYGGCSSCFGVIDQSLEFDAASQFCRENGGSLLTISNSSQFKLISRYLEGLLEERQLWIGYRYDNEGTRLAVDGEMAPAVILNNNNFVGSTTGDQLTCIAVQGSTLVNLQCTQTQAFACMYTFAVPEVSQTPPERIVYLRSSQANFNLSVDVTSPEASALSAQWRMNGVNISPDLDNYVVTAQDRLFSLRIVAMVTPATYELLVTGLAGTAVSATWQLKEPVLGDITVQPQNITVLQGQIAAFECKAENSLPRTTVTWYKDSIQLNVLTDSMYVSDVTGTLFVRDVGVEDAGGYHCVCENGAGQVTSRVANLTPATSIEPNMANFFINPRPLTVLAGEPFNLECVGAQSYDNNTTAYRFFYNQSFVFTEPNAEFLYPRDAGFPLYRIEAVTVDSSTTCTSCTISARNPRRFNDIQASAKVPLIVHSLAKVTRLVSIVGGVETESSLMSPVPSGADVALKCEYSGVPTPSTVEWTLDGVNVNVGVVTEGGVSTLTLTGVTSGGVYQCHVRNQYDRDSASVYICLEEQESVVGVVSFTAEPHTNSSLYISWETPSPLSTHLLLIRYKIEVEQVDSLFSRVYSLPPGTFEFIASGLIAGELYRVSVVANSLLGPGEAPAEDFFVRTFDIPITDVVSGLKVQRTSDNSALVVIWEPIAMEMSAALPQIYELEYRLTSSSEGLLVIVGEDGPLAIEGLDDAASYKVRIRVRSQTHRDPPQFFFGPWSDFVEVVGITTLPPPSQPVVTPTGGLLTPMELLLIYVCVPVGVVLLVGVWGCLVITACCCRHKHQKRVYRPSKKEGKGETTIDTTQRPMGSQVYALPINGLANQTQVWLENNSYDSSVTAGQNTTLEGPPITHPVKQNNVSSTNSKAATPALSVKSGTVTLTYYDQNSSNSSSPIPDPESESVAKRPFSELTQSQSNGDSAKFYSRPGTATPAGRHNGYTTSTKSLMTPNSSERISFNYAFQEASSAADDLYKLAVSLESDLSHGHSELNIRTHGLSNSEQRKRPLSDIDMKNRRLSDEYDSLEPSPDMKEEEGGAYGVVTDPMDFDFKVLEELAAESAALASQSGTPDPYAYNPPTSEPCDL